jgi:hypothetical protein
MVHSIAASFFYTRQELYLRRCMMLPFIAQPLYVKSVCYNYRGREKVIARSDATKQSLASIFILLIRSTACQSGVAGRFHHPQLLNQVTCIVTLSLSRIIGTKSKCELRFSMISKKHPSSLAPSAPSLRMKSRGICYCCRVRSPSFLKSF